MRGRPTKLTPEVQAKVVQAVSVGAPYELASLYAGLNRDTVWRWLKRGENSSSGKYRAFSDAVKEAEGKGVVGCLAIVRKAGQQQWQAAAWMLERRYPALFGRVMNGEQQAKDPDTITIKINAETIKEILERRLSLVNRARLEDHSGNGQGG